MALFLLAGSALASEQPAKRANLKRREEVCLKQIAVKDGRLRTGNGRSYWRFRKTPRGTLIQVYEGGWSGWYLNYDHRGKDRRVGLVPEPGPGCYWQWTEGPREKSRYPQGPAGPGGPAYLIRCQARPANGPLKDLSLSSDENSLVLADSPKKEFHFIASIDGPYSYK